MKRQDKRFKNPIQRNIQPQVKLNKRAVIKPNSKPEEIFLNKNMVTSNKDTCVDLLVVIISIPCTLL